MRHIPRHVRKLWGIKPLMAHIDINRLDLGAALNPRGWDYVSVGQSAGLLHMRCQVASAMGTIPHRYILTARWSALVVPAMLFRIWYLFGYDLSALPSLRGGPGSVGWERAEALARLGGDIAEEDPPF